MKRVPFADKPRKSAYTWHDIERRAAMYDIAISLPAPYPAQQSIMATLSRVLVCVRAGASLFVRAARRWLQVGQETGSEPNLSESLRDVGVEPQRALALATTAEAKAALMEETDRARDFGIFGSPTFVVGRELFWGDDRLEDAISWYNDAA